MKKHEAFQFLVKRRAANTERKISRKELMESDARPRRDTAPGGSGQGIFVEIGSLRLSPGAEAEAGAEAEEASSPAPKRRGSISPFLVGPGTPPPIIFPGSLALDLGLGGEQQDREQTNSSAHAKQEQQGKKNTKKRYERY